MAEQIDGSMESMMERPVTLLDVYHLLERFATMAISNALSDSVEIESEGGLKPITLKGASKHFNVYDRGSWIIATPKDLFSHERTTEDALQTARAMIQEVYDRKWVIEMAGFDKMLRAAWVMAQHLEDLDGRKLEILDYAPTQQELDIYIKEAEAIKNRKLRIDRMRNE